MGLSTVAVAVCADPGVVHGTGTGIPPRPGHTPGTGGISAAPAGPVADRAPARNTDDQLRRHVGDRAEWVGGRGAAVRRAGLAIERRSRRRSADNRLYGQLPLG